MPYSGSFQPRQGVEDLFTDFLVKYGEDSDFEALFEAHPAIEAELRRLHSDWVKVDHALGRIRSTPRDHSLGVVAPPPAPAPEEDRTHPSGSSREVLERLAHRASSFGRYTMEEEVARGAMGAILRVFDEDLGRHLAMKVVLGTTGPAGEGSPAIDERLISRFLEEARISAQLDHPGIAPVHELGLDDKGRVYFTMKLVKGRDLKRIFHQIRTGDPDWTQARALGVILKVCEAMAYAHSKNAIHRDLKPSNVMVGRFGEVYVMDWGLARIIGREDKADILLESESSTHSGLHTMRGRHTPSGESSPLRTRDGDVIGTPAYMAPEQAAGLLSLVGPLSDVYSVGAMLYHLLTGRAPFMPDHGRITAHQVLDKLLFGPPVSVTKLAPDTPADLVAICEKAMAREAEDRYASTLEMGRDIEAFLDRRPVKASGPRLRHALRLALERHKPVAATAALAATILLVAAGLFVVRLEEARAEGVERGDALAVRALRDGVDELYPVKPAKTGDMERWLAEVDDVLSRADIYQSLRESTDTGEARAAILGGMLEGFDALRAMRLVVADRLETARTLRQETVEKYADEWRRVKSDLTILDEYNGMELELEPMVGLVPLRIDPMSGLEEFWVPLSGARPEIDAETERYRIGPETGIVLVLLPGADYLMGAAEDDPDRSVALERQHLVTVDPFYIGKYEVTQGQWIRVMGRNVARYQRATKDWANDVHPIETVSWLDAQEFARRLDLNLLTEEQWEYAHRAGSQTAYAYGESIDSIEYRENIKDVLGRVPEQKHAPWEDGFPHHAPVGSFVPNDFGLQDMGGNVSEWCRNRFFEDNTVPHEEEEASDRYSFYAFRGGSWYLHPLYSRSAFRQLDSPESRNQARGLRVGLELDD